jgi:SAM-dependent MidA family methyltransferase
MSAEAEIRRRIQQDGAITFAKFMDLALFWPQGGYYLSKELFGASGDYYTSPLARPAFGALLAVQLFQIWRLMGCPNPFPVVELG